MLSFTLFIVRDFSTPKTCHCYCDGGGGRIFQNGVFFKVDENCNLTRYLILEKFEILGIEPSSSTSKACAHAILIA